MDRLVSALLVFLLIAVGYTAGYFGATVFNAAQAYQAEADIRTRLHAGCITEATAQFSAIAGPEKIQLYCDNMVYGGGQ